MEIRVDIRRGWFTLLVGYVVNGTDQMKARGLCMWVDSDLL